MRALARPAAWLLLPVLASLLAASSPAAARPGGLGASGCHTNWKTVDDHCHRATRAPASSVPSPDVAPAGVVKEHARCGGHIDLTYGPPDLRSCNSSANARS